MEFIKAKSKELTGFTLIELLIAVSVLGAGIVGMLCMFPMGIRIEKSAQLASVATQLGQAKMEEIISKSYDDPDLLAGTTTESYGSIPDFSSYKRVTAINCVNPNLQQVNCDYDQINDPNPIKKIKVDVFWKSPFGAPEKSIYITTLIAKK